MSTTKTQEFLSAFRFGGLVNVCIDWIRYNYDLPCVQREDGKTEKEICEGTKQEERYNKLPQLILQDFKAWNYGDIVYFEDSALIEEIEANLEERRADSMRLERYLLSLLTPFAEPTKGCGLAKVLCPLAEVQRLQEQVERYKDNTERIERYQKQIEWERYVSDRFMQILAENLGEDNVEGCMGELWIAAYRFAVILDAVLLKFGIDFMQVQKDYGVYLIERRSAEHKQRLSQYLGTEEIMQRYLERLQPQQPQNVESTIPQELRTAEAMELLDKAKEVGLLDDTYKWNREYSNTLAGCFVAGLCLCLNLDRCKQNDHIPWRYFAFMGIGGQKPNGQSGYENYKKTKSKPKNIELVEAIVGDEWK